MRLLSENNNFIICECENCNKNLKVPKQLVQQSNIGLKVSSPIYCSCGKTSNIIKPKKDELFNYDESTTTEELIKCPKCKSTQLTTNDKGFGLGKAAIGGALLGPVGLLGGVIGSKNIRITCLKCGHNWMAGK